MSMRYEVQTSDDMGELEKLVEKRMREGWALCGGLAIDGADHYTYFYQAMIKEEEEEDA